MPPDPKINELRELFRNLQEFRAVFESTGVEEIVTPLGNRWSLWDLEYLYACSQELLTRQQRRAISLCLVHNMREQDAAVAMGVSSTNPVMMYATLGIRRLLDMIESGRFDRFRAEDGPGQNEHRRRVALMKLADTIKEQAAVAMNGCWIYPTPLPHQIPLIRIRSIYTSSGFMTLNPMNVMYEAFIGQIPSSFRISHTRLPENFYKACVNPDHGFPEITEEGKKRNEKLLRAYEREKQNGLRRPVGDTRALGRSSGSDYLRIPSWCDEPEREERHPDSVERTRSTVEGSSLILWDSRPGYSPWDVSPVSESEQALS